MTSRINHGVFLLAALAWVTPATAFDTLTAGELKTACTAESASAPSSVPERCTFYVHGFLDGAFATDPRVASNVERALSSEESFSERAFRTRLGPRIDRFGPSVFADFCVPLSLPLDMVVGDVLEEVVKAVDMGEPARELVYRSLRTHYPCRETG